MYKFTPREEIHFGTIVPESPPSIIIPSDVPLYLAGGFYPSADSFVSARSFPTVLAAAHVPELQGYSDMFSTWPVYSFNLPVVSNNGASRFEDLITSFVPI